MERAGTRQALGDAPMKRPRVSLRWCAGPCLLAFTLSCNGSGGRGASPGSGLTATQWCDEDARVFCESLSACCPQGAPTCRELYAQGCREAAQESLQSGLLFDGQAAQRCVDLMPDMFAGCGYCSLDDPTCSEARRTCSAMWLGEIQVGGPCTSSSHCAPMEGSAVVCEPQDDAQRVCQAVPVLSVGVDCSDPTKGMCSGLLLYCDNSTTPPSCAPRRPAGAACKDDTQCSWSMCDESTGTCVEQELTVFCSRYGG